MWRWLLQSLFTRRENKLPSQDETVIICYDVTTALFTVRHSARSAEHRGRRGKPVLFQDAGDRD